MAKLLSRHKPTLIWLRLVGWYAACHLAPHAAPTNVLAAMFWMAPPPLLVLPSAVCWLALIGRRSRFVASVKSGEYPYAPLGFAETKRPLVVFLWVSIWLWIPAAPLLGWSSPRPEPPFGPTQRVLTYNVHKESRDVPRLLALIQKESPDVVVLQENRGGPKSPAAYLMARLPEWHMVHDGHENAILSRYPIREPRILKQNSSPTLRILSATISVPKPYRIVTAHWVRPHFRTYAKFRHGVVAQTHDAEQCRAEALISGLPVLLAGDFNLTPRSPLYAKLSLDLKNAHDEAGGGTGWNYPSGTPFMRIDQIFGRRVRFARSWVGPNVGSDHRPILADFEIGDLAESGSDKRN